MFWHLFLLSLIEETNIKTNWTQLNTHSLTHSLNKRIIRDWIQISLERISWGTTLQEGIGRKFSSISFSPYSPHSAISHDVPKGTVTLRSILGGKYSVLQGKIHEKLPRDNLTLNNNSNSSSSDQFSPKQKFNSIEKQVPAILLRTGAFPPHPLWINSNK